MTVQVFVAACALLLVLEDVVVVAAAPAKALALADAAEAAAVVLVLVQADAATVVAVLAQADAAGVVAGVVLLVLTAVLTTVPAVAVHCARVVVRDVQEGVQVHVKELALGSVKDAREVVQVLVKVVVAAAQEVVQVVVEEHVQQECIVAGPERVTNYCQTNGGNMKKITITEKENNYIEKLWYDYNSLLNLITYMTKNGVGAEEQEYYQKQLSYAYMALEVGKQKVCKRYIDFPYTSYTFNFEDGTLDVDTE